MTELVTGMVVFMTFELGYLWGRLMAPSKREYRRVVAENNRLKDQLTVILRSEPDPSRDRTP